MKAYLLPFIFTFLVTFSSYSQTNVSGVINNNTTWTKANSPYVLSGDVTVSDGTILTLEAGTTLKRDGLSFQILIDGAIDIAGEESDSVFIEDSFSYRTDALLEFKDGTDLSESSISYLSAKSSYSLIPSIIELGENTNSDGDGSSSAGELRIENSKIDGFYLTVFNGSGAGKLSINSSSIIDSEIDVEGKFVSELEISDSYLNNTDLRLVSHDFMFLLKNSRAVNGYTDITYDVAQYKIVDSEISRHHINGASNTPSKRGGEYLLSGSKFINSRVRLPESFVSIDKSIFYVSQNVTYSSTGHLDVSSPIVANGVEMVNSQVYADGGFACLDLKGTFANAPDEVNSISNSFFQNKYSTVAVGAISVKGLNGLTILNSNFDVYNTQAITNYSEQDIEATNNHFEGYSSEEEIEQVVFHQQDAPNNGLVDFSSFSNSAYNVSTFSPPRVVKKRKSSAGGFIDELGFEFLKTHSQTDKLRIYKIPKDAFGGSGYFNREFVQEVESPFSAVSLSLSNDFEYLFTAVKSDGTESFGVFGENDYPELITDWGELNILEDESLVREFKVFDREGDIVQLELELETDNENLADISSFEITELRTESDTTFYQLEFTPNEEMYGDIDLTLKYADGVNSASIALEIKVLPVNEYKPVIEQAEILIGDKYEETGFSITRENLFSIIQSSDQDGGRLEYFVTEIINGRLRGVLQNGADKDIVVGDTISNLSYLTYITDGDIFGEVDAFKLKASDGEFNSDEELLVKVNILANNDPPTVDPVPLMVFEHQDEKKINITGLSPGPNESEDISLVVGSLSYAPPIPLNDFEIILSEDSTSAVVSFDYEGAFEGLSTYFLRISDGITTTTIPLNIILYEKNEAPSFSDINAETAYVGEHYSFEPSASDKHALSFKLIDVPEFINVNESYRIANLLGSGYSGNSDGVGYASSSKNVSGMAFDNDGNLLFATGIEATLRKMNKENVVTTFAGNGNVNVIPGNLLDASLGEVKGIAVDDTGVIYTTESRRNNVLRVLTNGDVEVYLGSESIISKLAPVAPRDIVFDSNGNMFILGASMIMQVDGLDNTSEYINSTTPVIEWGGLSGMAINSKDEIILSNWGDNSLFKVVSGVVEKVELPDENLRTNSIDFLTDDIVVFSTFTGIYTYDLSLSELKKIAGSGSKPFENGMLASDAYDVRPEQLVVKDGRVYYHDYNKYSIRVIYPTVDSLSFTPNENNIGYETFKIEATDLLGLKSSKYVELQINPTDKVTASNVNQSITYSEDEIVELEDIVISGLQPGQIAEITLMMVDPAHGILTSDSGNGESYQDDLGKWFLSGTTEVLNDALHQVKFVPNKDLNLDTKITVKVILKDGNVPNVGEISLNVLPENDVVSLDVLPDDVAYTEIPYDFTFNLVDPDDYLHKKEFVNVPNWLSVNKANYVTTISGKRYEEAFIDGTLDKARYAYPAHLVKDTNGNVFFSDAEIRLRKISSDGHVTTVAGTVSGDVDGSASQARFKELSGVAVGGDGTIYVSDVGARKIKKITPNGDVVTIAGTGHYGSTNGHALVVSLAQPEHIILNSSDEIYFVENHVGIVKKLDSDGVVKSVLGDYYGDGPDQFNSFRGVIHSMTFDHQDNLIIGKSNGIYKVDLTAKTVTTIVDNTLGEIKDGPLAECGFNEVKGLKVSRYGELFFLDEHRVRMVTSDSVVTLAGGGPGYEDGLGTDALFYSPSGLLDLENGTLLVADRFNSLIRQIELDRTSLSGVPSAADIGLNELRVQFYEGIEPTFMLDMNIEVKSSGMPVLEGVEQTFLGAEDDEAISVLGLSISEVPDANIELNFTLSNPLAGTFSMSPSLENQFDLETGEWKITGTQSELNAFLSSLKFYPNPNFYGNIRVGVQVARKGGMFTRDEVFWINIVPQNDAPEYLKPQSLSAMEEVPLNVPIEYEDLDSDIVEFDVENLPEWLSVGKSIIAKATKLGAPMVGSDTEFKDGAINEAVINTVQDAFLDEKGDLYFVDSYVGVRKLSGNHISTIWRNKDLTNDYNVAVRVYEDQVYFLSSNAIYKINDGEAVRFLGGVYGDDIGSLETATFGEISDFISDGEGGFFIADNGNRKIKHLSKDGQVTNYAGNGSYSYAETGKPLEVGFYNISSLKLAPNGKGLLVGHNYNRTIRKIYQDNVETLIAGNTSYKEYKITPSGEFLGFHSGIDLKSSSDDLVSHLTYANINSIDTHGQYTGSLNVVAQNDNDIYFIDDFEVFWKLSVGFDYYFEGIPLARSQGGYELNAVLNDGRTETFVDIPLNVAAPDRPTVTGLPQNFTADEASEVLLDPIAIDSEGSEFELSIDFTPTAFASVSSDDRNMDEALHDGTYALNGTKTELNNLLSSLTVQLDNDFDEEGKIILSVKEKGGKLAFQDTVHLNITPVNDAPQILNLKDTTAFVGDSLAVVVDAFDIEDGKSIEHLVMSKPDWLNHMRLEARDEIVAGNSGGGMGFETKSLKEAKFHSPGYLDFDIDGNLLVADAGLHSILKLDLEKDTVSVFAGSLSGGNSLGAKLEAAFNEPVDMAVATDGTVYVADKGNNQIKAILPSGEVVLIAGSGASGDYNGSAETASFSNLKELYLDKAEQNLYVNDNMTIRRISLVAKSVWRSDFTLNIQGQVRSFYLAENGDYWVFVDYKLYQFDSNGFLKKEFGSSLGSEDGPASEAKLMPVTSIFESHDGQIYFVEFGRVLRKIDDQSNVVTVLGDLNWGAKSGINEQIGIGNSENFVEKNGAIYFTDYPGVRKIVFGERLFYGTPTESDLGVSSIEFSATDSEGLTTTKSATISVFETDMPFVSGLDTALYVKEKQGQFELDWIRVEGEETAEFELSIESDNHFTYQVNATPSIAWEENLGKWFASGSREELNNLLSSLTFSAPSFEEDLLTFTIKQLNGKQQKTGSVYLFAEPENDTPEFNMATTYEVVAGETLELKLGGTDSDGDYLAYNPAGLPTYASADSLLLLQKLLYPVYSDNFPDSTLQKLVFQPSGFARGADGKVFYTDRNRHQIRVLDPISGLDEVFAGTGTSGMLDGPKEEAEFSFPYGLLVDNGGNLIVSDFNNASLRKITPEGNVSTIIGTGQITDYYNYTGVDGDITVAQPWNSFGLTQGGDGSIYMAQYLSVAKLNTNGYYEYLVGDPNYPDGIGDIDGNTDIAKLGLYVYDIEYVSEDSLLIWDASNKKLKLLNNSHVSTLLSDGGVNNGFNYKDGNLNTARIGDVRASTMLNDGRIIFGDATNNAIRMLDLKADTVYTVLGKGYAERAYGRASEIGYQEARDFLELDNGDILVAATGRIDRLTHSVNAIAFNPQIADVGEHKFTMTVSDGRGGTISEEITINVVAPNTAPEALDVADVTATYGDGDISVSLFDFFNDQESADTELTYEVSLISDEDIVAASPVSAADGVLSLSVIGAGESDVTVVATDPEGLQASTTFKVTVAQAEATIVFGNSEFINDETEKSVEVTTVPEGLNYTITYNGSEELPSTIGDYEVVVTIDEANYYGSGSTTLNVLNSAPYIVQSIDDMDAVFTEDLKLEVLLSDYFADLETNFEDLVWNITSSDEGAVLDREDAQLSINGLNAGESTMTISAIDPEGLQASTTFKVTVAQAEASVVFGNSEFINDETEKSVEVTTIPEGLNYTITYNGSEELPSTIGDYEVVVTIDEANYYGSESTTLSIQNVAPEALSISNLSLFENQEGGAVIGELTVVDQNSSDTHTYTLESGVLDNDLFEINEGTLVSNTLFNFEEQATYQVAVEAIDNYGGTFTKEFTIEIQDVNETPTIDDIEAIEIVKNLGQLSINLTGIGAGEELDQDVTVTASVSGVLASAQVNLQEGNTSGTLIFETSADQEGEGLIAVSVKDNGGTENGGVDELVLEIPIKVLSPNIQVVDGSNCGAGIVTLTASGADSFVWYDSPLYGNSISTDNQLEVDLTNSKVYYVSGVFDGVESSLRVPVNAFVFDELTVPEIQNVDGVLSTEAVDGMSYQWLLDGNPIDGATSNEYTPEETGDYAVEITNENGCLATSANLEVVITAIESGYEMLPMRAYPSPADRFITLEFDMLVNKGARVELIDQSGKASIAYQLEASTNLIVLDVTSVSSGVHTVIVKDGVKLSTKKVLIQR